MKKLKCLLLAGTFGGMLAGYAQQALPYQNPLLPAEARAEDLLFRMTLEEKVAQIRHLHSWDVFDGQQLNKDKLEKNARALVMVFLKVFR